MKRRANLPPIAYADLRDLPGTRLMFWVVDPCPLCGSRHIHPAGHLRDDPRERLGEVAAPCEPGREYVLTVPPRPRKTDRKGERRKARRQGGRSDWDDE